MEGSTESDTGFCGSPTIVQVFQKVCIYLIGLVYVAVLYGANCK